MCNGQFPVTLTAHGDNLLSCRHTMTQKGIEVTKKTVAIFQHNTLILRNCQFAYFRPPHVSYICIFMNFDNLVLIIKG